MDSLLDYFTSVAQIAIETQIENFLYKKLCDGGNMKIVLDKYNESFTEKTQIDQLNEEQKKRGFKEKDEDEEKKNCQVCKTQADTRTYGTRCIYCSTYYDRDCINPKNGKIRNLCPNCNKPFVKSYPCPNILVHSNILKEYDEVQINNSTWESFVSAVQSGGRTRRKRKKHKWTRNRKKTNGKRAKSNKKRVQKKKPTKTRKYRSFILLSGGGPTDTSDPIEGKVKNAVVVSNAVRNRKNRFWNMPLYDEAMGLPDREQKFLKENPHADAKNNMKNLRALRAEQFKYQYTDKDGNLTNKAGEQIKDTKNIRTQIRELKDSFEKKRDKAAKQDSITDQLFGKPKNESGSSSGCCQQTPYNDFIRLISLIFNMSTDFIKEFFGLGEPKEEEKSEGTKPEQSDILDKIMEILVSSIKLTLPDALGKAFKEHMTKLYMSESNKTSMKQQIKLQTIKRIQATYLASKIKDLQVKGKYSEKGTRNLSLKDN